jgi:hypothetical protein
MVPGGGLLGKLVEFAVERIAGKNIDLLLDDKKKACRAFVELHSCIERLDEITGDFIESIELEAGTDHFVIITRLRLLSNSIELLSNRFFELGNELGEAIKLYDSDLARAVGHLYFSKFSILLLASEGIKTEESANEALIEYVRPSSRILTIDMDAYFRKFQELKDQISAEDLEWPTGMLIGVDFEGTFEEVTIKVSDFDSRREFAAILRNHRHILSTARMKLREFIKSNFDVSDIVYVSRGRSR